MLGSTEGMVLLKNAGTLPLTAHGKKIAFIGPHANSTQKLMSAPGCKWQIFCKQNIRKRCCPIQKLMEQTLDRPRDHNDREHALASTGCNA